MAGERAGDGHREATKVSRSAEDIAWDKLMGEARAFENWYLPSRENWYLPSRENWYLPSRVRLIKFAIPGAERE